MTRILGLGHSTGPFTEFEIGIPNLIVHDWLNVPSSTIDGDTDPRHFSGRRERHGQQVVPS